MAIRSQEWGVDRTYERKLEDLDRRIRRQDGTLDAWIREAAARGARMPTALQAYVHKVRTRAYTVTDEDVERIRAAGYSEDQVFELTVAAAYGAALARLRSGLDSIAQQEAAIARKDEG
jgi:alkylhydroperoxidase family enzyme